MQPTNIIVIGVLTGSLVTVIGLHKRHHEKKKVDPTKKAPPGSFGWWLIGESIAFFKDPRQFDATRIAKYGPSFLTHLFFEPSIRLGHAEDVRTLLSKGEVKGDVEAGDLPHLRVLFGTSSIMSSSGPRHLLLRRLVMPHLIGNALQSYVDTIDSLISNQLEQFNDGTIHSTQELKRVTLDITFQCVVGEIDNLPLFHQHLLTWKDGILALPINLPFTTFGKAVRARNELDQLLKLHIQSDTASPVIQSLIADVDETCVLDNLLFLISAGHNTSFHAMQTCSTMLFMPENASLLNQIREEIVSNGIHRDTPLDMTRIRNLKLLHSFMKEALRIHSVASVLPPRRAVRELSLVDGSLVPPGTSLSYTTMHMHTDPAIWGPATFNPYRFMDESGEDQVKHSLNYAVFGRGNRVCPGEQFALLEIKVFLIRLVMNYQWTISETFEVNGFTHALACRFNSSEVSS